MHIGIYNRWLATMGGGEKHSLAVAEYLAQKHKVSVISHTPVEKTVLGDRLALNLSNTEFLVIPQGTNREMSKMTEKYDLFINASHMDFFPVRAPHSILLVYFPIPVEYGPAAKFRRWIGLHLQRWLMVPVFVEGGFGIEVVNGKPIRRLDRRVRIKLPPSKRNYRIRFALASHDPTVGRAALILDGNFLREVSLPPNRHFIPCQVKVTGRGIHQLTIEARPENEKRKGRSPFWMTLTSFEVMHPRYHLYQLLFERWFKKWGLRLQGIPPKTILEIVDTYDVIWANSEFTSKWISKYWNRSSSVLPPPVDVDQFEPTQKDKKILSVGRFFAGSHNKKHLIMIKTFKKMADQGLDSWEFHLVGGTTPGAAHKTYLQRVYAETKGYPITIHTDAPFNKLVKLYGESAIYWHASGFGEDEDREPIKFEHFGITTVEAMAAGCVPIVIGKGGQPEIVKHGHNGFLWNTLSELQDLTWNLIRNPELRRQIAETAIKDSYLYDRTHFRQRLYDLLRKEEIEV